MAECTFQPKTNRVSSSFHFALADRSASTLYDRQQQWREQIDTKLNLEKRREKMKETTECVFQPNINPSEHSLNNTMRTSQRMARKATRTGGSTLEVLVKGSNTHMARILEAN